MTRMVFRLSPHWPPETLADRMIVPEKPFSSVALTKDEATAPTTGVTLRGLADKAKSVITA